MNFLNGTKRNRSVSMFFACAFTLPFITHRSAIRIRTEIFINDMKISLKIDFDYFTFIHSEKKKDDDGFDRNSIGIDS